MTEQLSVEQGNKLIAEFDGWKYIENGHNMFKKPDNITFISDLKYHSSWDWLMPVVHCIIPIIGMAKYQRMPENGMTAHTRTFGMRDIEGNYMVRFNACPLHSAPTLIEATWLAVVEFIKWYNQNKQ